MTKKDIELLYGLDDKPSWVLSTILGIQQYLTMFGATVSIPFIICPALCIEETDPARSYILSTLFFVSGINTLIQTMLGVRLPIVQGGTFAIILPTLTILSLEENKCPDRFAEHGWESDDEEMKTFEWQRRMVQIQGAVIVSGVVQLIIGCSGLIGLCVKFITPITIAPVIAIIGLSLFKVVSSTMSTNWYVSIGTVILVILFSQYLREANVPVIWMKNKKMTVNYFKIFNLFPVLQSVVLMWALCGILTSLDVFSSDDRARTDRRIKLIQQSDYIFIPYPFQWGWPDIRLGAFIGMMSGLTASAIESIGDYYACARLSGAPPPPTHAINRGIGTEGLGILISGCFGTGNATTSYSENIGSIGITKVASRRVILCLCATLIILGVFPFIGSVFLTIPDPIVGGLFCSLFGLIAAVGLSTLQFVDLNSSRNLFILGIALLNAFLIPDWLNQHSEVFPEGRGGDLLKILFTNSMFVTALITIFLDNTIPGTDEERGMSMLEHRTKEALESEGTDDSISTYDLPIGMDFINKNYSWTKYFPFLPTFTTTTTSSSADESHSFFRNFFKSKKQNQKFTKDGMIDIPLTPRNSI